MNEQMIYNAGKGLRPFSSRYPQRLPVYTYYRFNHMSDWQLLTMSQREATQRYVWVVVPPERLPKRLRMEALLQGIPL